MTSMPAQTWDLTVALDYGQFYLYSAPTEESASADISETVETAIDADGIAQSQDLTVILSPHQNNFEMKLRVEQWPAPPGDDLDSWQEAFEAVLDVDDRGLTYVDVGGRSCHVPVPPGRYLARVTGRGFVARGWPGSTKPGDHWRIQLWPTQTWEPPRRLAKWDGRPAQDAPPR